MPRAGCSKPGCRVDADEMVEMILDTIRQTLKEGASVKLPGFGSSMIRKRCYEKAATLGRPGNQGHVYDSSQYGYIFSV